MSTFSRFEDSPIWQRSREVCREIYGLSGRGTFRADGGLRRQIQRAAVSVMANVAEGAGWGGDREFARFLVIARGSAAEVRSHLWVARDVGHIDAASFERLAGEVREIECMIGGRIHRLRTTPHNGAREKPTSGWRDRPRGPSPNSALQTHISRLTPSMHASASCPAWSVTVGTRSAGSTTRRWSSPSRAASKRTTPSTTVIATRV